MSEDNAQPISTIRFWDRYSTWEEAETQWESAELTLRQAHPLKTTKVPQNFPGITQGTRKHLRLKALHYLVKHDVKAVLRRALLRKPLSHASGLLRSLLKKQPFARDDDFFLFGFTTLEDFRGRLRTNPNLVLVAGFSYCHKPFECPSGRFTDECIHDPIHTVCGQCFIGKCVHSLPLERNEVVLIPTVHYIAKKMFDTVAQNPQAEVIFLITACELTLEMFADSGNMAGFRGVGVRLQGLVCNNMRAFHASEKGIKPGLTVVPEKAQGRMLELIALRREHRRNSRQRGE